MKITICGSIAFFNEMLDVKNKLEQMGHEVKIPPLNIKGEKGEIVSMTDYYNMRKSTTEDESWIWDRKEEAMKLHFEKVAWSDAVLTLNYDKNNIKGYVGANTLMEMGLAMHLGKKIFLLNSIPQIGYKEEILGMKPKVISGNLSLIA